HSVQNGQPEACVEGEIGGAPRSSVQSGQFVVRDLAEPAHVGAGNRLDVAPAARADNAKLAAVQLGSPKALDEAAEILARLERRDGEHVVALCGVALNRERRADGVRN